MEELWFRLKIFLVRFASLEKRSRFLRYSLPVLLILIILLFIQLLPDPFFHTAQSQIVIFLLLIYIVTFSAWFGGFGPGIQATFLTAILDYSVLFKKDLPNHSEIGDLFVMITYVAIGMVISTLSEIRYQTEVQKDEFLRLTAHELKNPLSSIKGFAGLITNQIRQATPPKMQNYAENIQYQSDKLLEIINDLLDTTKIEVGKLSYKKEPFIFDNLIKETISHQQIINKNRKIVLFGHSKKIVVGDRYRIGQVITNLLTNALKYSPKDCLVEVRIKNHPRGVTLQVKDYGIGISQNEQNKIFFRLYRAKEAEHSSAEGLGLGLYISSQIVQNHNGKLWVKSKEGHGSTFFMKLSN